MKPSSSKDGTQSGRVRKAWRLPLLLVQFLRSEARSYELDLTHLVIRVFSALRTHYDVGGPQAALLERDRRALRMQRWEYLAHGLYSRVQLITDRGAGSDGPATVASRRAAEPKRVRIERFESGTKVLQNWFLPPELLVDLREEAERLGWTQTAMAVALLNMYAGFYPLPAAGAAELERERLMIGLGRWEYFQHIWWRRAERVAAEQAGFDRPGSKDPR